MHEGNIVMVEGGIMHEPKVGAFMIQPRLLLHSPSALTKPAMRKNWYIQYSVTSLKTQILYGETVNINLVRDQKTRKPNGYCFLGYENQRSTVLAVDDFSGIEVNL